MKENHNQNGLQGISQLKVQPETTEFEMTASEFHSKKMSKNDCQGIKNHYINLDVFLFPYFSIILLCQPGSRVRDLAGSPFVFGLEQVTF